MRDLDRVKEFIGDALFQRFHDDGLVFDPILVKPDVGWDGDDILWIEVIFKGDQRCLDPRWTVQMGRLLHPELERLGIAAFPVYRFIERSEWMAQPDWEPAVR